MYFLVASTFFPHLFPEGSFKIILPPIPGIEQYYPDVVFKFPNFWFWLIPIFLIIFFHESMHAVLARLEKIPVRGYGLILLLVIPIGAFVRPDEKKFKKLKTFKKLKIYAAGSMGNFILALIVAGLLFGTDYVSSNIFETDGVLINSLSFNSPAHNASLSGVIIKINDVDIDNTFNLTNAMKNVQPEDTVYIETTTGQYNIKTIPSPENSSRPYLGVQVSNALKYKIFSNDYTPDFVINSIVSWKLLLIFTFILSIGIGIFNMLPIPLLDGGLFYREIFIKYFGEKIGKKLITFVSLLVVALLITSITLAFI